MKCQRGCGVEVRVGMLDYAQEVGDDCAEHTDARCADALSSKLATAQKNYFDICDAVCRESASPEDACRQARETREKLATAERVVEAARLLYWTPPYEGGTLWNALTDYVVATGRLQPRALGIDPSKEQGK